MPLLDLNNIVKHFEVSDAKIKTTPFNSGSLYVTPTGHIYMDSPVHNKRIELNSLRVITDVENFNNLLLTGTYVVENVNCDNAPLQAKGVLNVVTGVTLINQRFTGLSSDVYTRSGIITNGVVDWRSWTKISAPSNLNTNTQVASLTSDITTLKNITNFSDTIDILTDPDLDSIVDDMKETFIICTSNNQTSPITSEALFTCQARQGTNNDSDVTIIVQRITSLTTGDLYIRYAMRTSGLTQFMPWQSTASNNGGNA